VKKTGIAATARGEVSNSVHTQKESVKETITFI